MNNLVEAFGWLARAILQDYGYVLDRWDVVGSRTEGDMVILHFRETYYRECIMLKCKIDVPEGIEP